MRAFALDVVLKLRDNQFTAYWAGGCVRDFLLGHDPHDYDVATDAQPQVVRKLFPKSVAVGAQFGVIEVLGSEPGIHVQVATFRSDGAYTDGRHPDSVRFGTPQADAQRRDFTINGLFYDPIKEEVIDYVNGRADLQQQVIRAIGNPADRICEDKLRMLRAVRFVSRLGFDLDPVTRQAIAQMHDQINQVSAERITDELKKMLSHPHRTKALVLLANTRLLKMLLPEFGWEKDSYSSSDFLLVSCLPASTSFILAWAAFLLDAERLHYAGERGVAGAVVSRSDYIDDLAWRFRLSNDEKHQLAWLLSHNDRLDCAHQLALADLKPLLAHPGRIELFALHEARYAASGGDRSGLDYALDRTRQWSTDDLDPAVLVNGQDVAALGVRHGPAFKTLLEQVRRAQLNEEVTTRNQALALLKNLVQLSG